jgi:ribosomal protein S6
LSFDKAGVTNPLEYPYLLDKLGGRTLACKIKLQQNWGNYSVSQVKGDDGMIEKIRELFPKNEVCTYCFLNK